MRLNENSLKIAKDKTMETLSYIFHQLDGDKDGYISFAYINVENVPHPIVKMMYPIFNELQLLDNGFGPINQYEFLEAAVRLFSVSISLPIPYLIIPFLYSLETHK